MKDRKYQSYIRNHWPLPFVEPWLYGPTKLAKKPFKYNYIFCTRFGDKSGWHYYANELADLGHSMDKYLAASKHLLKFKNQANKAKEENRRFSKKIEQLELNKLSLNKIAGLLKSWYFYHSRFSAVFMPIDATDETLEKDIRVSLSESKIELSFSDVVCLLTPDTESYVQKEHKDFCDILKKSFTEPDSLESRRAYKQYAKKWWWSPMGWGQHKLLEAEDIRKKVTQIKDLNEFVKKQEKEEKQRNDLLKQKRIILKSLPRHNRNLLNAFEVLAQMHDVRKEIQMRMMRAGFLMTEAILKKCSVPKQYRDFMLIEEYVDLAKGVKPSLKVLKSRRQAFWCQAKDGGKISMLSGEEAIKKIKQSTIYEETKDKQQIIRGVPASQGYARGRARVGFEARILIRDFKDGEILVTGMTTPDFVPAMKKAAAIITDEGGITCHAAIIAREMNKPCIIGTKIATKVLKDGDRVEVDAVKGVVKKI